jgi:hypothetical protein
MSIGRQRRVHQRIHSEVHTAQETFGGTSEGRTVQVSMTKGMASVSHDGRTQSLAWNHQEHVEERSNTSRQSVRVHVTCRSEGRSRSSEKAHPQNPQARCEVILRTGSRDSTYRASRCDDESATGSPRPNRETQA